MLSVEHELRMTVASSVRKRENQSQKPFDNKVRPAVDFVKNEINLGLW